MMRAPLQRVRHSIDTLQKNIYEYHYGSSVSLGSNSVRSACESKTIGTKHGFIQVLEDSWTIIQALFVRLIFTLSVVMAVWRVVQETQQVYFWYLLVLLIFLLLESYATVYLRKGYEYKWFCPSAFAYLIAIVPCIWLLELNHSHAPTIFTLSNQTFVSSAIPSRFESISSTTMITSTNNPESESTENMFTTMNLPMIKIKQMTWTQKQDLRFEELLKTPQEFISKLSKQVSTEEWHMIIEQMTLLVLILSRWLLPKGELTREELSQLLLVYIGIAADIIEFFEVFKETRVRTNMTLSILVLVLWTLSLLQFCLALTVSRGRKSRADVHRQHPNDLYSSRISSSTSCCSPSDFWGMLLSLLLQDMPFFCFRAVLIFHYHILSYSTVFFTSKNGLIIVLQCYRISVIIATTVTQERHRHRYQREAAMIKIADNKIDRINNNNNNNSDRSGKDHEEENSFV